nr:hypothetical protein [Tanacetum cinerariifolium]
MLPLQGTDIPLNRTLAYLISTSRSSEASSLPKRMSASGILSLPEVDGIDEGNRNDDVGSGVNIGNGIRNGGNGYD